MRQSRPRPPLPVTPLAPSAATLLRAWNAFLRDRQRIMDDLLGSSSLKPNYLREDIIRLAVLAHAGGAPARMSDIFLRMRRHATEPVVKDEVDALVRCAVLQYVDAPTDRRSRLVIPTQRTIDTYETDFVAAIAALRRELAA